MSFLFSARLWKRFVKGLSLFIILAIALTLFQWFSPSEASYTAFVDTYVRAQGFKGIVLFVALVTGLVSMGIPRQLLSFIGGYTFGALYGGLLTTLGVIIGCVLSFFYSRFMIQSLVQRHFGNRIHRLEVFLLQAPFSMALVMRLLPIGSNQITNLAAGMTRIPAAPFIFGSALGYLPQNLIFALLGSGARVDAASRTLLSAALFLVATLIGYLLYRRHRKALQGVAETEEAVIENC